MWFAVDDVTRQRREYRGDWADGLPHGMGTMRYFGRGKGAGGGRGGGIGGSAAFGEEQQQFEYEGRWDRGFFHGEGTFSWYTASSSRGQSWTGRWRDGQPRRRGMGLWRVSEDGASFHGTGPAVSPFDFDLGRARALLESRGVAGRAPAPAPA